MSKCCCADARTRVDIHCRRRFTLKSEDETALGDFKVTLVGHPTKGLDSVSDLKVTIEQK